MDSALISVEFYARTVRATCGDLVGKAEGVSPQIAANLAGLSQEHGARRQPAPIKAASNGYFVRFS